MNGCYVPYEYLKSRGEYYQEFSKVSCRVIDEWEVEILGEEAKTVPYKVERISEEEFNKKYPNGDCKENVIGKKEGEWIEFAIAVDRSSKDNSFDFENGVLVKIKIGNTTITYK